MEKYKHPPLIDTAGRPTEAGLAFHGINLIDQQLKNHADPNKTFAISPEYKRNLYEKRKKLEAGLDLPKNHRSRGRVVFEASTHLAENGFPAHRRPYPNTIV